MEWEGKAPEVEADKEQKAHNSWGLVSPALLHPFGSANLEDARTAQKLCLSQIWLSQR